MPSVGKRVETAMWRSPSVPHHRWKVPGRRLWNHALDADCFEQVREDTDYTRAAWNALADGDGTRTAHLARES